MEDNLERTYKVLPRLEEHGIKVNLDKCEFLQPSVTYSGYVIYKDGIHLSPSKVDAIYIAPAPKNVSEQRPRLGLLNYYGKFIESLSTLLQPLHHLLENGVAFEWSLECKAAFAECKARLSNDGVLVHYHITKPLQLAYDASPYGVGAVLSHILEDGTERPMAFASRTLSPSEKGYDQLKKETPAIVFGIKKYHKYLYG